MIGDAHFDYAGSMKFMQSTLSISVFTNLRAYDPVHNGRS